MKTPVSVLNAAVSLLEKETKSHVSKYGRPLAGDLEKVSRPILNWLSYLDVSKRTGVADELLDGVHAAMLEACAHISLGMARAAIFSMRSQIDLMLGWAYYKDHAVEWSYLNDSGSQFRLKADVIRYLEDFFPRYKVRFSMLLTKRTRPEDEPYKILSAHIHGQTALTAPKHISLEDVVYPHEACLECIKLQMYVAEYISDVLMALFADNWAALPASLVKAAKERLTGDQLRQFF